jgi:type VI secretion system secreted protein Hcp
MGLEAFVSIKGKIQGQFKGEGTNDKRKNKWMAVVGFAMGLDSPLDLASGHPSGRRQWRVVKIVKEWGAASPQLLQACATNEVLSEVVIEFLKTNAEGEEYVYQTVTLTNSTIAHISRFTKNRGEAGSNSSFGDSSMVDITILDELEEVEFSFQKIVVEDVNGGTSFADDWLTG